MHDLVKKSKFLSYVLRHHPEKIGLELDENGWADTANLLEKLNTEGQTWNLESLKFIVDNNNKKRFAFSEDFMKIRANQGHSIEIDLALKPKSPPEILYHGTAILNILFIKKQGLLKGNRQHVHLSTDESTAKQVGRRHGKPVVLVVKSGEMNRKGHLFFLSENGVWLTEAVPAEFLVFPS